MCNNNTIQAVGLLLSYSSYNKSGFKPQSRFKARRVRESSLYLAQWTVTLTSVVTSDL